jgi:hypothetical protein
LHSAIPWLGRETPTSHCHTVVFHFLTVESLFCLFVFV